MEGLSSASALPPIVAATPVMQDGPVSQVVGDPPQHQVSHDLPRDHEGGEHAHLPGRRPQHGERVHGIEPRRHGSPPQRRRARRGYQARLASPRSIAGTRRSCPRIEMTGRPRRRRRLPDRGERGVGDGHEHRAEEEAEAVAPRSRHRPKQPDADDQTRRPVPPRWPPPPRTRRSGHEAWWGWRRQTTSIQAGMSTPPVAAMTSSMARRRTSVSPGAGDGARVKAATARIRYGARSQSVYRTMNGSFCASDCV